MKKLYIALFIASFISTVTQAQLTLTKAVHEPVVGDVFVVRDYDSTTVIPKNTGAGQTWNFNSLSMQTFTEAITYTTVASAPSSTAFPTANLASNRNGNSWELWKTSTTMLEFAGMSQNASTDRTVFSNLGTWNNWPVSFGNTNSDAFAATDYAGTVTSTWNGNISYTATGTGTVILPGGNVHPNCLQITKTITLSAVSGTNTLYMAIKRYDYWSSLTKSPIIEIEYNAQTTGTTVSTNYNINVNIAAMSVGIKENQLSENSVIVYPNPAANNVNIFLPENAIATSLEIVDVTGKTVAATSNSNSINVETLAKGIYSIRVKVKDSVLQRALVISE